MSKNMWAMAYAYLCLFDLDFVQAFVLARSLARISDLIALTFEIPRYWHEKQSYKCIVLTLLQLKTSKI